MPLKRVTTDTVEVLSVNASVIGVTTFADFEMILKIVLLVLSIGYTIARWRTHCSNKKK
jgi:cytochrome c oxidase assembly factor CtaG